jgi:hypothetical protein
MKAAKSAPGHTGMTKVYNKSSLVGNITLVSFSFGLTQIALRDFLFRGLIEILLAFHASTADIKINGEQAVRSTRLICERSGLPGSKRSIAARRKSKRCELHLANTY